MKIQAAQRLRLRAKAGPDLLDPGLYFSRTQPLIYKGNEHESLDTLAAILTPDGISASDVKYGWPRYPIKLANAASFAGLMALLPRLFNEYRNAKYSKELSHGQGYVFAVTGGWLTIAVPTE